MDAYNYLIEEYKPLILSIAKKFNNIEKEDLFQAGALGLKKAFDMKLQQLNFQLMLINIFMVRCII